jgi:hypothetical protein
MTLANCLKSHGLEGFHRSTDLSKSVANGHINNHNDWHLDGVSGVIYSSAPEEFRGLLVFSAADEDGPRRQANALQSYLASLPADKTTPKHFSTFFTLFLAEECTSPGERSLSVLPLGRPPMNCLANFRRVHDHLRPQICTLSSQAKARWARVGLELLRYPVFGRSLEDCELYLKSLGCTWVLRGKIPLKYLPAS